MVVQIEKVIPYNRDDGEKDIDLKYPSETPGKDDMSWGRIWTEPTSDAGAQSAPEGRNLLTSTSQYRLPLGNHVFLDKLAP